MIHWLHNLYCRTEKTKKWFNSRFTRMGKVFLLVVCIALFFGLSVQRTMIYQIFAGVFAFLFFSYLLTLRFTTHLLIKRHLPETCVAGEQVKYKVSIENRGIKGESGVYIRESFREYIPSLQEFSTIKEIGEEKRNIFDRKMLYYRWLWLLKSGKLAQAEDHQLPDVLPGKSRDVEVRILPLRRGNIHFKGIVLGIVDPFGLCRREIQTVDYANILVLPKLYAVPPLFFDGARKYHQGGITAAQDRGDSNEFLSLREYVYGDPVKHIDWKATARSERAIVKQYRDEYYSRYGLVLDSFTSQKYSKVFEEAVSVAASILMSQDNVNTVLDLLFVENECVTCTIGCGLSGHQRMLEILASVETCRDMSFTQMTQLVKSHSSFLSGIVVVLIDLDDERRKLIKYLVNNNIPTKVVLLVENKEEYDNQGVRDEFDIPIMKIEIGHVEEQLTKI